MRITVLIAGSWLLSVPFTFLAAQEPAGSSSNSLSLFEAVEVSSPSNERNSNRPNRESRVTTAEPEFTLLGTSRVGDSYSAIVRHRSGDTVIVKASPNANTAISEYTGFSVVDISSATASIRYPNNTPCMEFSDLGVRCNAAGNIAELVLANGEPLPATNAVIANQNGDAEAVVESLNPDPANPFEALREAQNARGVAAPDGSTAGARFTPRRIDPADVPEGMRVIATPFGDRLVEQ